MSLYKGEGDSPEEALKPLSELKDKLKLIQGLRILGPLEAPVFKVKDRFRMQLILKAWTRATLGEVMRVFPIAPGGSISLDRDPLSFGM